VGVSTHSEHFETRFSFRTRILDYIYFNLPVLCSKGDFFESLVQKNSIGITVNPSDREELKRAILTFGDEKIREKLKRNIKRVEKEFYWDKLLMPLKENLRNLEMQAELQQIEGSEIFIEKEIIEKAKSFRKSFKYLNKLQPIKKILPFKFKIWLKKLIYKKQL
jgi:hypothetical protein